MSETSKPPLVRNERTPEGKAMWDALAPVANAAPQWAKERIDGLQSRVVSEPGAAIVVTVTQVPFRIEKQIRKNLTEGENE